MNQLYQGDNILKEGETIKDIYSEEELKKLCSEWQKILRLQDWKIDLRLVHYSQTEGSTASVYPSLPTKSAVIKIVDPASIHKDSDYDEDYEDDMLDSLVHELVHLHLEKVKPTKNHQESDFESAIVLISEALVSLYRRSQSKTD